MCGIVGAIAERNITPILIEGLKRLEYRGYDSAGVAVFDNEGRLQRCRRVGKVASLEEGLAGTPLLGRLGIAHTRWATHGAPTEATPTRISPATNWRWCTTASSRTTNLSVSGSRGWATCSPRRPTPRSSSTCCTTSCSPSAT